VKKLIILGTVMAVFLSFVILRRADPSSTVTPGTRLASEEPQPILQATPPMQTAAALPSTMADAEMDPDRAGEALEHVVESISDSELPARLEALANETNPEAVEMRLLLVDRWAQRDPMAAAAWVSRLGESPPSRAMVKQVAVAWANTDLTAAASWLRALPEGEGRQIATIGLAYEAARTEPLTALDLAVALPPTRERDDLLVHAVSQWAGVDASVAADWTLKVPDPILRQRLVASVAIALAGQDPVAAVALAVNGLAAGDEQDRAAVSIVQRWAQQSPQTAASWVAQFPEIPSRDPAMQNLFSIWAAQDSEAAENWRRRL